MNFQHHDIPDRGSPQHVGQSGPLRRAVAGLAVVWLALAMDAAAQQPEWALRPYRIQAVLAVDGLGGSADQLANALPNYLAERAAAAVGPLWELEIQLATGAARHHILNDIETFSDDPEEEFNATADKLVLLGVRSTLDGYELTAREFDRHVLRWGPALRRSTSQQAVLAEDLFILLSRVVAPLAEIELDPNDPLGVILTPRGSALPAHIAKEDSVRPGDVLLPILRRTSRTGELQPDGVQVIPWTFIEAATIQEDGRVLGKIHSGSRRPLGVIRRGRIEQVAIALRTEPGETQLQLVSRANASHPLSAYQVESQNSGEDESTLVGLTDRQGIIRIRPGGTPVQIVALKNGGELLARLPVVPGFELLVVVRLPDDDARMQAETRLAALREELIDVVARRSILLARVKQKIETGDFKVAKELLTAVDRLPGRSQFNQELGRERRLIRAGDARAKSRIEQLIGGTEVVLNQFLDAQPVRELQQQLSTAESKESGG